MTGRVQDKVAIVTGGASGIGLASAEILAREGAKVVIADIQEELGKQAAETIRAEGGEAEFCFADMTKSDSISTMVEYTVEKYGRLDIAFNNAGAPGRFTTVVDCTEEEWDFMANLNLKSVWLCMKAQIPHMIKAGGGAIVNTSSGAARLPARHMASYVTTKAGVIGLTRSAAVDFATENIRVNALLPGVTLTPMMNLGESEEGLDLDLATTNAMQRVGKAEEQADVVLWLCSNESSFVTGIEVSVDGGYNLL